MSASLDESTAPLLDFEDARFLRRDGSISDARTFHAEGPRVALVGSFTDFFALLAGKGSLASGRARIAGGEAALGVREGRVGLALFESEAPANFTGARYLEESALLAGLSKREARLAVTAAVQRFELAARINHRLSELSPLERRALAIVSATLGNPPVLCVEAPLYRLDSAAQAYIEGVLWRAAEHRSLLVSIPELPAAGGERALADALGAVVHESGARTTSTGTSVVVSLASGSEAFCRKLTERGLPYRALGVDPLLLGLLTDHSSELLRLVVDLESGMTETDLFVLACEVDATLLELGPA